MQHQQIQELKADPKYREISLTEQVHAKMYLCVLNCCNTKCVVTVSVKCNMYQYYITLKCCVGQCIWFVQDQFKACGTILQVTAEKKERKVKGSTNLYECQKCRPKFWFVYYINIWRIHESICKQTRSDSFTIKM